MEEKAGIEAYMARDRKDKVGGVKCDLLHYADTASCPWIGWLSMDITDINRTMLLISWAPFWWENPPISASINGYT